MRVPKPKAKKTPIMPTKSLNTFAQALSQSCSASRATRQRRGLCTVASAASATADGAAGAGQPAGAALGPIERLVAFQQAFWKFLRPHTIRGTILGSIAVTARALIESPVVGPRTPYMMLTKYKTCLGPRRRAQHIH